MKLIIDIDDNVYDDIEHNKGEYINTLNWAVRNGTPISTGGDLINRSELKKAIQKLEEEPDYQHEGETWQNGLCMAEILIDNAPTVDAIVHTIEVRTQAEWIEKHSDYGVYYQCSNCHKMPPNYECDYKEGAIKTNYCPNCGADMRGSNNE